MTLETKRAFIRGPLAFRGPGPRPAEELGDPGSGVRTVAILQKERLPNGPPSPFENFPYRREPSPADTPVSGTPSFSGKRKLNVDLRYAIESVHKGALRFFSALVEQKWAVELATALARARDDRDSKLLLVPSTKTVTPSPQRGPAPPPRSDSLHVF